MDSLEKRVIRWKRHLLSSSIVLNEGAIEKLQARGLIWNDTLEQIKGDFSNFGRMWKYLELLTNTCIDGTAFEAFCDFLGDQHPWLGEELRVELLVEKQQLEIDEYMRKEAAQLVHRYYGTNKKLAELDKRKLEELIAVRAQVAKEVWRRIMESTRRSLEVQAVDKRDSDERLEALTRNVDSFADAQRKKISKYSGEVFPSDKMAPNLQRSIDQVMTKGTGIQRLLLRLEAAVEKLQLVASMCVLDYESLREEKSRSLALLNISDMDAALDKEMKIVVSKMGTQLTKAENKVKDEEGRVERLQEQVGEMKKKLDDQVKERDQNIRFLASSLEKAQDKISVMEMEALETKEQLNMANAELAKFKVKSKYLEKTRHYGYGYFYDGYPSDYKKHPKKDELPRIGSSPRQAATRSPPPHGERKVVTHRPQGRSGLGV